MFAYCNNNPVLRIDESGSFSILGAIVGGVTGFVTSFATGNGLKESLITGMKNAFVGGMETYAVLGNAVLALFEFNDYMMNGMDMRTALCLTAVSFGTSFLSANLFSDMFKLKLDEPTKALVDLTFGEGINLMASGVTTAVSNQYPKQSNEVYNSGAYHGSAPSTPFHYSGAGGAPRDTFSCIM